MRNCLVQVRSQKRRAEKRIERLAKSGGRGIRVASFVHILLYMWDCKAGRHHGACVNRLLAAGVHIVMARYGDVKCFLRWPPSPLPAALLGGLHMPSNRLIPNHPTRKRTALQALWNYLDLCRVWPISLSYAPNLKKMMKVLPFHRLQEAKVVVGEEPPFAKKKPNSNRKTDLLETFSVGI